MIRVDKKHSGGKSEKILHGNIRVRRGGKKFNCGREAFVRLRCNLEKKWPGRGVFWLN